MMSKYTQDPVGLVIVDLVKRNLTLGRALAKAQRKIGRVRGQKRALHRENRELKGVIATLNARLVLSLPELHGVEKFAEVVHEVSLTGGYVPDEAK